MIGLNVKYVNIEILSSIIQMDQKYKAIFLEHGRKRQQCPKGQLTTKTEAEMK